MGGESVAAGMVGRFYRFVAAFLNLRFTANTFGSRAHSTRASTAMTPRSTVCS
jgi:hypothetical protein